LIPFLKTICHVQTERMMWRRDPERPPYFIICDCRWLDIETIYTLSMPSVTPWRMTGVPTTHWDVWVGSPWLGRRSHITKSLTASQRWFESFSDRSTCLKNVVSLLMKGRLSFPKWNLCNVSPGPLFHQ
jgi:hypothetical protein